LPELIETSYSVDAEMVAGGRRNFQLPSGYKTSFPTIRKWQPQFVTEEFCRAKAATLPETHRVIAFEAIEAEPRWA
jgi:hypothetical protein